MDFITHDSAGRIIRAGNVPEDMVDMQAHTGETIIRDVVANINLNYVVNGEIRTYTSDELTAKNNLRPGWVWQMPERVAVDMRALADVKAAKWSEIKAKRSEVEAGTFTYNGFVYQTDLLHIPGAALMAFMAQLAGQPFSEDWTLNDNTVRTLDAAEMIAVGVAQGEHVKSAFETTRSLRGQIEAASTIEQVEAVVWPT